MKNLTILLLVLMVSFASKADELSSRTSVEKLMELTEVSKMMDSMQGQINMMFQGMSKQMNISAEEKGRFDEYMKKVNTLLNEKMNWNTFKEPIIDIYSRHFTEKEVQGLIKFYQSDIGKSMTKKMPLIMQDSMIISQELIKDFMPEIQSLAMELRSNINQSRQSETAVN